MDSLYSLIPRERVSEILETLSNSVQLSAKLLDENGRALISIGEPAAYCDIIHKKVFSADACDAAHLKAGQTAYALGESYIFCCHAGLNHIAYPLVSRKLLLGVILLGPFLMDSPDSTTISEFSEKKRLSGGVCLDLYDEMRSIPVISPRRVRQISRLTGFLFAPLMEDSRLLMREKSDRLYQQSRINETIQIYKGAREDKGSEFFFLKEQELISKVRAREIGQAKALLNELLGYVLLVEGNRIDAIKSRAIELTALLSRVAINKGAQGDYVLRLNTQYLNKLQSIDDYEGICFALQEIVTNFIEIITMPQSERESPVIRKAVEYVAGHFHEPITLQSVSDEVGVSASYLSVLFSKQMNASFRDYLARVRIDEAKNLLVGTDYPINQIAVSVGYSDQASFTKAFRRVTGTTPYQMR